MDGHKVLVIEGDSKYVELCTRALEQAGFRVFTAASGGEGQALAENLAPALILLNLATPGTNGLEICKAIHGRFPEMPILLLTQKEAAFNPIYTANYGIVAFLKKPFSGNALVETVRGILKAEAPAAGAETVEVEAEEADEEAEEAEEIIEAEQVREEVFTPYATLEPQSPLLVHEEGYETLETKAVEVPEDDLFEKPEPARESDELAWMDAEATEVRFSGLFEPTEAVEPATELAAAEQAEAKPLSPTEKEAEVSVPALEVHETGVPEQVSTTTVEQAEEMGVALPPEEAEDASASKKRGFWQKIYVPAFLVPLLVVVGFAGIYLFNRFAGKEGGQPKPAEMVEERIPQTATPAEAEKAAPAVPTLSEEKAAIAPEKPEEAVRPAAEKPKMALPGVLPTESETAKLKAKPKEASPAAPKPVAEAEAKAPLSGHFVQFGYFGSKENASKLAVRLKGMGLKVKVAEEVEKAKKFYRVVLEEAFASEAAAKKRAGEIKATHGVDAIALSKGG